MPELLPKIAELSEKLRKDPASRLFVPLAEEYVKADMLEEAIQVLTDGLKKHPDFLVARATLGKIYFQQGKFAEARREFEEVVKVNPDNLIALRKLAVLYRQSRMLDQAKRCCDTLLVANPKDPEIQQLLMEIKSALAKDEQAEISNSSPKLDVTYGSAAQDVLDKGHADHLVDATAPVQEAPPSPPPPPAVLPPAPVESAPPKAATEQADVDEEAAEELVSPTLAQLYMRQGHYAQAVRVYDELLRREPNNDAYRQAHNMAVALSGQAGTADGTDAKPDEAGGSAASAPPAAPAAADEDFAVELLSVGQSPQASQASMIQPPAADQKNRKITRLQSWLLHIQQQRRRRAS